MQAALYIRFWHCFHLIIVVGFIAAASTMKLVVWVCVLCVIAPGHLADKWTAVVPACIQGHNDWQGPAEDADTCKELCLNTTMFTCLSIEFKGDKCQLSRHGQLSVSLASDYQQPCNERGWWYAERLTEITEERCQDPWSPVREACIRGNNERDIFNIETIEDCKKLCMKEESFLCHSVDYRSSARVCHLCKFNQDSVSPDSHYTQPCYSRGATYSERLDIGRWTQPRNGCLRGNPSLTQSNVHSLELCQIKCINEKDFQCLSVDYSRQQRKCRLSESDRFAIDYTQPCSEGSDWQHSSRFWET